MSQRTRFILKLIVTGVLLGTVLYRIDLKRFWEVLSSASVALLLAAVLVQIGTTLLAVQRWKVILGNFDVEQRYPPLAKFAYIGFFFNLFLPSGIGGDFVRAHYLSKRCGRGMSTTLTTTVLERSAGLCALLLIGIAAAAVYPMRVGGVRVLYVFLLIFFAFVAANVALFHSWTHRILTRFLRRFKKEDLEHKMDLVSLGLRTLRRNPGAVVQAVGVSLLVQFFSVVIVWLAALSIRLPADFSVFLIFIPLVNLTIMVPITINGIGLRETVYIELFQTIGVSDEFSASLSLLHLAVFMMAGLPGGILYHLHKKEAHFPVAEDSAS